jgi:hypothetical protein
MASAFHGGIDAHIAIPAPQCGPGGIMNFNFGPHQADGMLRSHRQTAAWLMTVSAKAETITVLDGAVCAGPRLCEPPGDRRVGARHVCGTGRARSVGGPGRGRVRRHRHTYLSRLLQC